MEENRFRKEKVEGILEKEMGVIFCGIVGEGGVFKRREEGKRGFKGLIERVDRGR
ncbi:hypothetical protein [Bacillus altitudinis]|uniref:hypothetical protein n=1 Tax=Bacillus altitudinis TaxID=293387 RepID=UPI0016438548|nr:hypothetical protein [Bacillus altitudinis]